MHLHKNSASILIDVIALSEIRCSYPIKGKLAYATTENFIGRVINGYNHNAANLCLLTKPTALALCQVQNELIQQNLSLYLYDGYRPVRAVNDFFNWFSQPVKNNYEIERKQIHYPAYEKNQLVKLGYIGYPLSRHNFGNTIDLTLAELDSGSLLDMGACFDYFDSVSHNTAVAADIGKIAYDNRMKLASIMQKYGFTPYEKEFWHFELKPHAADLPMDLAIEAKHYGLNV
ncbi:MAG: M15 family metallopeptidase [Pseudomonadota bacterium]